MKSYREGNLSAGADPRCMYPRFRRSLHPGKYISPVELLYRPSSSVAEQTQPSFAWGPGLSVPVLSSPRMRARTLEYICRWRSCQGVCELTMPRTDGRLLIRMLCTTLGSTVLYTIAAGCWLTDGNYTRPYRLARVRYCVLTCPAHYMLICDCAY